MRAILDATDVYAWNPTIASHDEGFKTLGLSETAIYAIMNVDRKTVRVVRGSQVHVAHARAHPYIKKLGFRGRGRAVGVLASRGEVTGISPAFHSPRP